MIPIQKELSPYTLNIYHLGGMFLRSLLSITLLFIVLSLPAESNYTVTLKDSFVTQYVNPFIGTAGGGNTFPGAVVPWGTVSVSPHTSPHSPSGYVYGEKYFYGFGQVHLSGTGCSDLGSIIVTASRGVINTEPEQYKTVYSNESASPGFYSLVLDELHLQVEATATPRCSFILFHQDQTDGQVNLLFDCGRNLSITGGGSVNIISPHKIEGYNIGGGFCGENNRHRIYFAAEVNHPADSSGIWLEDYFITDQQAEIIDASIGAWMNFKLPVENSIAIKIGISYVSCENAWQNLQDEIPDWNFEKIKTQASLAWQKQLSRVQVEGGSIDDRIKFYTALYHMLIHPNIISDVNGEYPLMGRNGVGRYADRERYSIFSLWDTYRTLHPFLTLLYPERQSAMVQTMMDMYTESGWLPKWELAGNETYMMVGDPAPIVIADSYIKGITDFEIETAYQAMTKPTRLSKSQTAPPIRAGYHELLHYGYIPADQDTTQEWWVWGPVSTTLEYCLADWAIAQTAKVIGKETDFQEFKHRSLLYRHLFDKNSSFIRPRLRNGQWYSPFDPLATEGSGSWAGSGGPGYVEGHAWNYNWFAPHDIAGLINLFGGIRPFTDKLKECFSKGYFTITNEPDIAYPYLFTYIPGEEGWTSYWVKKIMNENFSAGPDGLPGNDDCGTISGWFVFSALGFYPACPAAAVYQLGVPLFPKAILQLNQRYYPGKPLVIEKTGSADSRIKPPRIWLRKKEVSRFHIAHEQLVKGGNLVFEFKK